MRHHPLMVPLGVVALAVAAMLWLGGVTIVWMNFL
jgi:hypothetical protein